LFAALNVLTGKVIGQCHGRHRHQEFLKFLRRLDRAFPRDLTLHVILDNYATHKHEAVRHWLAAHPRFELHFTPTGASWLNLVESWFSQLTQRRLRRGVFCSVPEPAVLAGFLRKLARTSPRCGGDRVRDHKPSLIRSRASWPQFLPRQAGLSPRTVSKDLWARSLRPRVRQLRQASLQRA
jgi:transposase